MPIKAPWARPRNEPTFRTLLAMFLLLGGLASAGCASVQRFRPERVSELEVGKTLQTDYQTMFGKPRTIGSADVADGRFELVRYAEGFADLGTIRLLDLEFRNGVLNAFFYVSNFDEDRTLVDLARFSEIKRGVTRKDQVLQILGRPHGKALAPSLHPDFQKKLTGEAKELWLWASVDIPASPVITWPRPKPNPRTTPGRTYPYDAPPYPDGRYPNQDRLYPHDARRYPNPTSTYARPSPDIKFIYVSFDDRDVVSETEMGHRKSP